MKSVVASMIALFTCIVVTASGCSKKETPPVVVEPNPKEAPQPTPPQQKVVGTVKFEVKIEDPTARVVIDSNEYVPKELAEPMPLPVGEHTVVLKLGGKEVKKRRFTVSEGKRLIMELSEPNREAAEWALRIGAQVIRIVADGKERQVGNLGELPVSFKVSWIRVADRPLSDADLEHFEGLDSLHSLQLQQVPITDEGLTHLRGLPALDHLSLNSTRVTDAGLPYLKDLPKLRFVDLSRTKVTDAGLAHLKEAKLTGLGLDETAVTDAGLAHLRGLADLGLLHLSGTKITDAGLEHLQAMSRLRDLGLAKTKITDAGLARLKALPKLALLGLRNTEVTDAGIAAFTAAQPKCKVDR